MNKHTTLIFTNQPDMTVQSFRLALDNSAF